MALSSGYAIIRRRIVGGTPKRDGITMARLCFGAVDRP
jgi:hypothetical protein